jgi:excisionase family DNA binding protein
LAIVRVGARGRVHRSQPFASERARLVTSLLREAVLGTGHEKKELFTVKEAAWILRVCTATVYSMLERGELPHVRVGNSIRIVVSALDGDGESRRDEPEQ